MKCNTCKYEEPATVRTILNGTLSGDLVKVQASLGANHTYRESEKILEIFSQKARQVNNHGGKITYILDWFHISMKMENISLPEELKSKFMRIKWHLWRGNYDRALVRLSELSLVTNNKKEKDKIDKFSVYIANNKDKIVDYRMKNNGFVFTSNLAESTVESLINKRCKGQQHIRWSRDGLNALLQLRATIHSDEWADKWRSAVLSAAA